MSTTTATTTIQTHLDALCGAITLAAPTVKVTGQDLSDLLSNTLDVNGSGGWLNGWLDVTPDGVDASGSCPTDVIAIPGGYLLFGTAKGVTRDKLYVPRIEGTPTARFAEDEDIFRLDAHGLIQGLMLWIAAQEAQGHRIDPQDWLCDMDASDADDVLQYALFGEVVFC